ncbi:ATP-binding protein, partial [Nocardia sp. CC201C]|uniref:AAA family ATPase n=1 Tax=Nocardia sp. CC201C TaxID=3044575 RepID=UPI0024A94A30
MAVDIGLVGRRESIRCLADVLTSARTGSGAALLLRGDPGIGKSALLAEAERRADGFRVLRAAGSEFEAELPFAGLHQLCAPELDRLAALPPAPRRALEAAFGLADAAPDLFAIGVGVLALLGAAGRERPLLCVVDDAQWLDDASARVLSFVARRIGSEPIAMLLAARMSGRTAAVDALPVVEVHGLDDADARALLAAGVPGALDDRVRERMLAEARGNPLALLELPRHGVMAGGFAVPDEYPVTAAIERGYRARLLALPPANRLLLTIASADPTGDPGLLWSAVDSAGLDASAAADTGGLADFDVRVRFCHPLARSVVYRAADPEQRRAAHGWLA